MPLFALGVVTAVATFFTLGPENGGVRAVLALAEAGLVGAWALGGRAARPRRVLRVPAVLLVLWAAAMLAATALAVHPAPAVLRSMEWAAHGAFALMLWAEVLRDRAVLPVVLRAIPVGFAATVALLLLQAAFMADPYHYDWAHRMPFFVHARYFGLYTLAGAVFAARPLLDPGAGAAARRWAWAGVALAGGAAAWTGGRTAVGAVLLGGAVLLVLAPRGRRVRFVAASATALAAGALLAACLPVAHYELGLGRLLGSSAAVTNAYAFTSARTELWAASLDAWRARPWLGLGPDAAQFVVAPFGHVQPHNVVVQGLLEWGVLGTVPALLLLGLLLLRAVRSTVAERDGALRAARAVSTAFLVGTTASGLLDGTFYDPRWLLLLAVATAVVLLPVGGDAAARAPMGRGARGALGGGAVLVAVLFALHLLAARAIWAPGIPASESARVRLLYAVPTPSGTAEVTPWVRAWAPDDPAAAIALARWGAAHAPFPAPFLTTEADLLLAQGDTARARARYADARRAQVAVERLRAAGASGGP